MDVYDYMFCGIYRLGPCYNFFSFPFFLSFSFISTSIFLLYFAFTNSKFHCVIKFLHRLANQCIQHKIMLGTEYILPYFTSTRFTSLCDIFSVIFFFLFLVKVNQHTMCVCGFEYRKRRIELFSRFVVMCRTV